jgi:acyl-CoA dehydrogenase
LKLRRRRDEYCTMRLELTAEEQAFQAEVRGFLASRLTAEMRRAERLTPAVEVSDPQIAIAWHRLLLEKGWGAPLWPREYGGPGWTPVQRYVFEVECARVGAPRVVPMSVRMVAPVIMRYGTEEQKRRYLPAILSGEDYWCQGYSEPSAGSDLASIRTRAVREGDEYVIDGTKIWTTHAQYANRIFALVRTSDDERKQLGITFLLIDMDSPGVLVRPIKLIGGDEEINQIFFDSVRVPVANRIGAEGRGWTYAKYLLEFERGGDFYAARLRHDLQLVMERAALMPDYYGCLADNPGIAARVSELEIHTDALEMLELQLLRIIQGGENPGGYFSSLIRLRASQLRQLTTKLAVDILGHEGFRIEPRRPLYQIEAQSQARIDDMVAVPKYLNNRGNTIASGASDILREIIAKLILPPYQPSGLTLTHEPRPSIVS